ncbi:para-nitrobenzyl esterase [Sphingobium sp. OAS761]|uniref:hypothetical protein n=1 Tax=Sphingobium sp. OAS761 TaxID=2817901 RepID=UPI00209FCA93|nr:hypothetical protein [Sphingobium sp. OAS761]MCP1470297.1 para-nitrobenzyl esterase [Sphingobium sp. OAS761]
MRLYLIAAAALVAAPAFAQTDAKQPAPVDHSAHAAPKYSTEDTPLGDLLDNPAAKAIIEKHIPGMTTNDQVDMARGMTLKGIQAYAPDDVTDERLAAIDAELAALK